MVAAMSAPARLRRREWASLAVIICWSVVSFLPIWREPEIGGVAVFGWLMAALMVLSPVAALLALRGGRE